MISKESQTVAQIRLSQWAMEIQECKNRPRDMTVNEWCNSKASQKQIITGGLNESIKPAWNNWILL